jgi:DNA-binding HxlR family transcriptional regulator
MRGYGQFCPVAKAAEVVSERWTILVVRELAAGSDSFNDLRRGMPLISPSLLSTRLKSLQDAGVVEQVASPGGGSRYLLTRAGEELAAIIWRLGTWGHRWARSELGEDELDPAMLMWDIHRSLDMDYFDPGQRCVVQFELTDYTSRMRFWWLVVHRGEADICMKDPGYDLDLQLSTTTHTLAAVWMGDSSMARELRRGGISLAGSSRLKADIGSWLGTNHYASVKPARGRGGRR